MANRKVTRSSKTPVRSTGPAVGKSVGNKPAPNPVKSSSRSSVSGPSLKPASAKAMADDVLAMKAVAAAELAAAFPYNAAKAAEFDPEQAYPVTLFTSQLS